MSKNNKQSQQQRKALRAAGKYLIYLLRCALHDEIPKEKPESCSWELLFQLAKSNSVESTASPSIQRYDKKFTGTIPEIIAKEWKEVQNQTIYRQLHFDLEREQIFDKMKEAGLSVLPLKGIYVAGYYPQPGMRWMCDNDILYGYVEAEPEGGYRFKGETRKEQDAWNQKAEKQLQIIMKDLGYKAEYLGGAHDVYQKAPFFNFEMHHRLAEPGSLTAVYYENPWKRAKQSEKNQQLYSYSDEDEYIYLITHAYKHFAHAGCGIRTLADEYVICEQKKSMDWEYVKSELQKLELDTFEERLRKTAENAFSKGGTLLEEDWEMIFYMLVCGTYGTTRNSVYNRMKKLQKEQREQKGIGSLRFAYMKDRLMISEDKMMEFYPFFYRHKMIRVVLPLYRILRGMVVHPRKLIEEWKVWSHFQEKEESVNNR